MSAVLATPSSPKLSRYSCCPGFTRTLSVRRYDPGLAGTMTKTVLQIHPTGQSDNLERQHVKRSLRSRHRRKA